MVDWGAGRYEIMAAELEPVAHVVVERAAIAPDERVLDLACGTGNAALLAAARGARVVGVDGAPRLLDIGRERAVGQNLDVGFVEGDLLALPVPDDSVDVVVSVFGLIFAADPALAMREIGRVLAPGGRVVISAWIPSGPIHLMFEAQQQVVARVSGQTPPERFDWSNTEAVAALGAAVGLSLEDALTAELAIRDRSPEAYIESGQEHPMAVSVRPVLEHAGAAEEVREAMTATLREANEDPNGFLVHSPYVVYELRAR